MPSVALGLLAVVWLVAIALHLREAFAYHRARRACEAMQDRAIAALERHRAFLEENGEWTMQN